MCPHSSAVYVCSAAYVCLVLLQVGQFRFGELLPKSRARDTLWRKRRQTLPGRLRSILLYTLVSMHGYRPLAILAL